MSGDLSEHFSLREFLRSGTATRLGIDMTPEPAVVHALRDLCAQVLEPLRRMLAAPIAVTSGYRPGDLNRAIGGARHSQHLLGQAADIVVVGMRPLEVWRTLIHSDLPFDQAIEEFDQWTHVSYSARHRRDKLMAVRVGGQTRYERVGDE